MSARGDIALQAYCDRLWQTHERRGQVGDPFYEEHFQVLEDPEHLYAVLLIENQIAGSPKGAEHLEPRLWQLVEDGQPEPEADAERRWRSEYAVELHEFWALNMALTKSYARGLAWVFQRAELSQREREVMRLRLAGDDVGSIARAISRQERTVRALLDRAEDRLKALGSCARPRGIRLELDFVAANVS